MRKAPSIFAALTAVIALAGCMGPVSSAQKLSDAAYELNTATRFGRMDVALERVKLGARSEFVKRHASWGKRIRIVDLDLGSLSLADDGSADVVVVVSWHRTDEAMIRTTSVAQKWKQQRGDWWMESEVESGDEGLLAALDKLDKLEKLDKATLPSEADGPPKGARARTRVIYEE